MMQKRHFVGLFFVLSSLWLFWSGHYTTLLLILGFISIIVVIGLSYRMEVVDAEAQPFHLSLFELSQFWFWLVCQILISNFKVIQQILNFKTSITPQVVSVPSTQKQVITQVIFANSITLTPGTVSLIVEDDHILVHSLNRASADELLQGEMNHRVCQLEREQE